MIEDCYYEPMNGGPEIIDFVFGASIAWLNLRGFYRGERTNKVARFAEIVEELKITMQK
jgi:hypothetical protein